MDLFFFAQGTTLNGLFFRLNLLASLAEIFLVVTISLTRRTPVRAARGK
jgi:hypothetical protein